MKIAINVTVLAVAILFSIAVQADDAQFTADSAVADILFDYDGADEFASYSVNDSGFVEITFANNIPDELYSEILERLRNNKDIDGVLAGTSGPSCSLF